ncbi:MAG TPA: hypothetical protein VM867_07850 [Xanthobacteraceae bacterium]|jgi:prophage tail gpP-like protein|nr:hypothetical protein [Xanthobacteraceae bacterium]
MPKPSEVAQLVVAGNQFEDWTSVWVQHPWGGPYPLFRFTASERDNLPTDWRKLQFKPGDKCEIMLGGQLGVTGQITERQVAYDASNHAVQLSGKGTTWGATTSSVDDKTGNFDNMSMTAIADKVLAPFGVKALPIGKIDQRPFDRMQAQPGELVFDFLDRIARMRGVLMGSDHLGNMLIIGDHPSPVVQDLIEGENILKMQCVFSNEQMYDLLSVTGQKAVSDDSGPRDSAEMEAQAKGTKFAISRFMKIVTEQPVKERSEIEARANFENIQREGTLITAYATVQGWLRDGKTLWRAGDSVWVHSPMAMLNMPMSIQTATFAQDNKSGTTTVLELVLPWKLLGKTLETGRAPTIAPGTPSPPDPATTVST